MMSLISRKVSVQEVLWDSGKALQRDDGSCSSSSVISAEQRFPPLRRTLGVRPGRISKVCRIKLWLVRRG